MTDPSPVAPVLFAGGTVRRTDDVMADGRSLHYYDDEPAYVAGELSRATPDTRPLAPAGELASQVRLDPLTGDWVAIATHRNERTFKPPKASCPLCPSKPGAPTEIPASDYDVVVFANRFPSLSRRATAVPALVDDEPLWPRMPGLGHCDVVCFSPQHDGSFADLTPQRARTVIEAWADRTATLSAMPGIRQVFCFENRGEEIGVTLSHPHGQIYAYPYTPPRTEAYLRQARTHRTAGGGVLAREVMDAELRVGTRVVLRGTHWSAYVPAAARWPVELHLVPHRDVPDLAALTDEERGELAEVYLEILRRADRYFEGVKLPYIAGWHQAPVGEDRDLARLSMQLFSVLRAPGKLKYLAGSESGMAAWMNDVSPEAIAERWREVAS